MPKHSQSPRLGDLSDFSVRPDAPQRDDIETRVANLERAVSEILHHLADLSERLDAPKAPKPNASPQSKQKKPKPTAPAEPQPEPLSAAAVATLSDRIYALLSDGTRHTKKTICTTVGCETAHYAQARKHLIATDRMQDGSDIVAGKICNVPDGLAIWTQAQVDAELQRRADKSI